MCHRFWPTHSIDVIVEGKIKGRGKETHRKGMEYREFPDVNRIGRTKAMTYISIFLGHYTQL